MVGKVFERGESWPAENLLFANQAARLFARLVGMINGDSAGLGKRGKGTEKRSQAKNDRSQGVECEIGVGGGEQRHNDGPSIGSHCGEWNEASVRKNQGRREFQQASNRYFHSTQTEALAVLGDEPHSCKPLGLALRPTTK